MPDWIENYRPHYANRISPDHVKIKDAAIILMDIDINSKLGAALREDFNPFHEKTVVYNSPVIDYIFENIRFKIDPTLNDFIMKTPAIYKKLMKEYGDYREELKSSCLVLNSPNIIESNGYVSEETRVKISDIIAWADIKRIPVNDKLRAFYLIDNHEENIKKFVEGVIKKYPKANSKDIISHCFSGLRGNTRAITKIKIIIKEFGVIMDKNGGICSKQRKEYMKTAPIYKSKCLSDHINI